MSFNVRTSEASVDKNHRCSNWFGERRGFVASQFRSVDADFVGTQETTDEQRGVLDGELKEKYMSIGKSSGSLNGAAAEVNAIYYRHQDWKLLADGMFWLGPNPDAPSAAWGMQYFRTCVYGRFQHIKSGETVCVLNTHYETPGNDAAQLKGTEIINQRVQSICQPGDKLTVLTGDLNGKKSFPAVQKLMEAKWEDPSDAGTFCGDMLQPTCGEKFDYVFHRARDGMCHVKSEVIRQEFSGCYASDHAVLVGTYCISGSCCGGSSSQQNSSQAPDSKSDRGSSLEGSSSRASLVSGDADNEADISPGKVLPSPAIPGSTAPESPGPKPNTAGGKGSGDAQKISTQSQGSSNATGTVFAIVGVIGVVAAVLGFVVRKKRALDAQLDATKSVQAPPSSFFTRAEADALSPIPEQAPPTATTSKKFSALARKFSSPVPTLGVTDGERNRSFSETSSIPCERRSSMSERFGDTINRMSSPVLLDARDSLDSDRASSRIYFSEVVGDSSVSSRRTDFALL
ncbi:hypothetical protein PINS_up002405 [Pythium insidiosum]|nr:hypothetical protein PINS_up002405 [Pythium insidiosum]